MKKNFRENVERSEAFGECLLILTICLDLQGV
jgi:hypothetical protein